MYVIPNDTYSRTHCSTRALLASWTRTTAVAPSFMSFHVAPHTESLSTAGMRAFERFLARMRVAMDLQAGGAGECFIAGLTYVAVLWLAGETSRRGRRNVMVVLVLPWVAGIDWRSVGRNGH